MSAFIGFSLGVSHFDRSYKNHGIFIEFMILPFAGALSALLILVLSPLLLHHASAQSTTCKAVASACELKLTGMEKAVAMANLFKFCQFLKTIYHSPTEGCMGGPEAQCCCCEKDTFVDPLNAMMKETKDLEQVWTFNPGCKDAPLQCDPDIDCDACAGDKECEGNPTAAELEGIDLSLTMCENTKSGSSCDAFECKAGYVKLGSATCMNGNWNLKNAKCLKPCAQDPTFEHVDNAKTECESTPHLGKCAFLCEAGYSPSKKDAQVTCNDGQWVAGPRCMKDDWCKLKTAPTTRINNIRLKPKPPRSDWDRGKELVARRNFRCSRGLRIKYKIPKSDMDTWKNALKSKEGSHDDVYTTNFPPSPVDLCEKACRNVTDWKTESPNFRARGFSLLWSQRPKKEVEEEHGGAQEASQHFKSWRGTTKDDPECYCEAGDSKTCLAEQNTVTHQKEGKYWRYDFEFEKDGSTPDKVAFRTSYSWDELRDPDGPFETPDWFEKPVLKTDDKIFGPEHQGIDKCDNNDKNDPCIDEYPDGNASQTMTIRSCTPNSPCGVCSGDCDTDDDCAGHLRCWQRSDNAMKRPEIDRLVRPGPIINGKLYYADRVPGCRSTQFNDGGKKNLAYTCKDSKRPPHKISCGEFAEKDVETESAEHDLHMDYCYDPNLFSAKCKADRPPASVVSGELIGGQTCLLEEAIVVPACTELTLRGVAGPHGDLANAPAIISGDLKTNHFNVNGQLTLKYLVLERGLAFDYRGGSLHVSGFEAVVHLIGTAIQNSMTTKDPGRELHGSTSKGVNIFNNEGRLETYSGGAIFLTPGDVDPVRDHNDGVRLILEGSTIAGNSAAVAGGAIFSRGSTIEVRKGTSVIRDNTASPKLEELISDPGLIENGSGGGIFMKLTGGLVVRGAESVLWLDSNEAFYGGGGILAKGWLPEISDMAADWQSPEILVEGGGTLKFTNNRAAILGGAMRLEAQRSYHDNQNDRYSVPALEDFCKLSKTNLLRIRGQASSLEVHNNSATIGGGIIGMSVNSVDNPEVINCSHKERNHVTITFESGSHSFFSDNQALSFQRQPQLDEKLIDMVMAGDDFGDIIGSSSEIHGGSIATISSNFYIKGPGTLVDVVTSSAEISGGAIFGSGNYLEVSDGATLSLHGNRATISGGGVAFLLDSTFVLRGAASTLNVSRNRADTGGGIYMQFKSKMLLYDGAALKASHNSAAKNGGAISIISGSSLISDWDSFTHFSNNIAEGRDGGGGAISISPGTVVHLDGSSDFSNNIAKLSNGGGISAHSSGKDDGSGACVGIQVYMMQASSTQKFFDKTDFDDFADGRKFTRRDEGKLQMSPQVAQLDAILFMSRRKGLYYTHNEGPNEIEELYPLSACVPCGEYELTVVPTKWVMPYSEGTRVVVTHTTPGGRIVTFLNSTEPGQNTLTVVTFNVGCEWLGLRVNRAHFKNNAATRGGAISTESRKNLLIVVQNSTFSKNVAVGSRGGAMHISGTGIGARVVDECVFEYNRVESGSGGAISVESSASLYMSETIGVGNKAGIRSGGGNGKGGFVYASFASSLFMQNVDVSHGLAVDGGAFAVIASKIVFDSIFVDNCTADTSGGAVLLDQGAEGHVFSSIFRANSAGSGGGHLDVSASSLIVHAQHASIGWDLPRPLKLSTSPLPELSMSAPLAVVGAKKYVKFTSGKDCESREGTQRGIYKYARIQSLEECREAAFLIGAQNLSGISRQGAFKRSNFASPKPRCFQEMNVADKFAVLRYDNTFRYRGGQTDAWRYCSMSRVCICRKVHVAISTIQITGNIFENGKSGESGGSFKCASSSSSNIISPGCSQNDAISFRDFASHRVLDVIHDRVCFYGGVRVGDGTSITESMSRAGGGAISATSCTVELDGANLVGNTDTSSTGGGAVHLGQGTTLLANAVLFEQNLATAGPGGALTCEACGGIKLTGETSFLKNDAFQSGGAIFAENAPHQQGMMSSSRSRFEGNTARTGDGGAVYESSNLDAGIGHWKSEGDNYVNNVAQTGSGGALAMIRSRAELHKESLCIGNKAPLGGGGCIFWEPQLRNESQSRWTELMPRLDDKLLSGFRANVAAFGPNFGTGGKSLDHDHDLLIVSAQDKTFPSTAFPILEMRDHYDVKIIRKKGLTGILEGSVLIAARQETQAKSNLGGATSESLHGPHGTAKFASLLLAELPSTGPHFISFETTINVGKGLKRIVKSRRNIRVNVGKCPKKGIKDCECPRGQVRVGHRCVCDGAAIIKQVISRGLGQHQEKMPINYFPQESATYLIGYFNASNTSAAGMESCPNREDQDDYGFCCAPCLVGADCSPCTNQTVETITKKEIDSGRVTPKCADSEQIYSLENDELTALPGYWKASPGSSDFMDCAKAFSRNDADSAVILAKERCCPLVQSTNGSSSASICKVLGSNITDPSRQCLNSSAEAYEGPSCKVCRIDYTLDASVNQCVSCPGGASVGNVFGGVFIVLALAWIVLTHKFMKADMPNDGDQKKKSCCATKNQTQENGKSHDAKIKKKSHIEEHRKRDASNRFLADQAFIGRVQGSGNSVASASDTSRNDFQVVIDRIKVFYGWLQIFSSLTITFSGVPWPNKLWSMSNFLSFVNFDPSGLFPKVAGCSLSVDFTNKLIVHLSFPVLLLGTIFLSRIPAFMLRRTSTQKRQQRQLTFKLVTSLSLIIYPGICTRIFSGMRTISIAGLRSGSHSGEVLQMDYSIEVDGATHAGVKAILAAGIVLYVAGIPLGVAMALWSNSKYLYDESPEKRDKHEACVSEFGTLYMQ